MTEHAGLRHDIARALGRALVLAEDAEGYTDWSEWHPCCDHSVCSAAAGTSPCPCSGIAYAKAELVDAVMSVLPPGGCDQRREFGSCAVCDLPPGDPS